MSNCQLISNQKQVISTYFYVDKIISDEQQLKELSRKSKSFLNFVSLLRCGEEWTGLDRYQIVVNITVFRSGF